MSRSNFTIEICIEFDGETVPFLTIDKNNNVTWFVSEEKKEEYRQRMLKNMGESMSRYYTAHPERLAERFKENCDSDE